MRDIFLALLLAGVMGLIGQASRSVIGLKKLSDQAAQASASFSDLFDVVRFLVSLIIGFIAGMIGAFTIGIDKIIAIQATNGTELLLGLAAVGYAGTDAIEAFAIRVTGQSSGPGATLQPRPVDSSPPPAAPAASARAALALAGPAALGPQAAGSPPTAGLAAALSIVAPLVKAATWIPALSAAFAKYDMAANKRTAAAMGQFLVEAGAAFQETVENLNYTTASRISAVFPHRFPTAADAVPYVGKPEALANAVYANKLGNGDEASGDGWKFRGRGLIQLTGRDEYAEFASTVGMTVDAASAYCETPTGAAMSGCWYLSSRGCLVLADTWQIDKITLRVNGSAMEGAQQRSDYSNAFLKALGG